MPNWLAIEIGAVTLEILHMTANAIYPENIFKFVIPRLKIRHDFAAHEIQAGRPYTFDGCGSWTEPNSSFGRQSG